VIAGRPAPDVPGAGPSGLHSATIPRVAHGAAHGYTHGARRVAVAGAASAGSRAETERKGIAPISPRGAAGPPPVASSFLPDVLPPDVLPPDSLLAVSLHATSPGPESRPAHISLQQNPLFSDSSAKPAPAGRSLQFAVRRLRVIPRVSIRNVAPRAAPRHLVQRRPSLRQEADLPRPSPTSSLSECEWIEKRRGSRALPARPPAVAEHLLFYRIPI
jgi:hypothetical protein